MTRLTIRDWLAVLIGSALGIGWAYWSILFSGSNSDYILVLPSVFSPYLSALITGLIAKKNERTLSGITILVLHYGLLGIVSYPLIQHDGWDDFWGFHKWYIIPWCFAVLFMYFIGRALGYLAVKLKGKKQTEQDIYLDLDKRLLTLCKKGEMKMKAFFAKLWTK